MAMFGSLFNDIYVIRTDSNDQVLSQVKVPLSYSPRRKFLERIEEMAAGEDLERQIAIKLPRMSFEIVGFSRDDQRQMTSTNQINLPGTETRSKLRFYTAVPYIINLQLNILAKNHDDALQVVEQIVPFFRPQVNMTITPIEDFPDFKEEVPISMQAVSFMDDYEGSVEQRRTIIYTLDFEMKANFYGPTDDASNTSGLIRKVDGILVNTETGKVLETRRVTPDPIDAEPPDDYGYNTEIIPGWEDDGNDE